MRIHPDDSRFYILDDIEEARQFRFTGLSRFFARKATTIKGAVHISPYLTALAEKFEKISAECLPVDRPERLFSRGKVMFPGKSGEIDLLNDVASKVGQYLEPLFGENMHMGVYDRAPNRQALHTHPGMTTAVLPLGANRLSTVWQNAQGKMISAQNDALVVIDETILHGSPLIDKRQTVLTISSYYSC